MLLPRRVVSRLSNKAYGTIDWQLYWGDPCFLGETLHLRFSRSRSAVATRLPTRQHSRRSTRVTHASLRNSASMEFQGQEVLSLRDNLRCSTHVNIRWRHRKLYALRATSYRCTYESQIFFFWFTSDVFLKRPILSFWDSYVEFLRGDLQAKVVPETDYLSRFLRSPAKSISSVSASRLCSDSLSWKRASWTQKNKLTTRKGTLSKQLQLTRVTPTVLLASWVLQPIKGVTSLGTDFEKRAIWQGSIEEPAAKDFVARMVCTIKWDKVQGTIWNLIKCEECLRSRPTTVVRQATINLIHKFGNPFGIPFPSCTALT